MLDFPFERSAHELRRNMVATYASVAGEDTDPEVIEARVPSYAVLQAHCRFKHQPPPRFIHLERPLKQQPPPRIIHLSSTSRHPHPIAIQSEWKGTQRANRGELVSSQFCENEDRTRHLRHLPKGAPCEILCARRSILPPPFNHAIINRHTLTRPSSSPRTLQRQQPKL